MRIFNFFIAITIVLSSCSTLKVFSDYDSETDFKEYKTYAFYKKGIKSVKLSDIDKKRILSAVEQELINKGFTNSENPDVLINIKTDSERHIDLNNNFRTGKYTKGLITVELIDYTDKKLVWQATATGVLNYINTKEATNNKEKQIKQFVNEIMAKYPPVAE